MKSVCWFLIVLLPTQLLAAELPVRHVVLYKHSIGYFQRSGQLAPGESARLDFKAAEMNDVLKSLTLQESGSGAGKVTGLRYDSNEPLDKKLSEFPFRLGPGQPLSAVLDQLKGAQLELKFASEMVRGSIVSARLVPRTEQRPETEQITLLIPSGEFRNLDLASASSIKFVDPALQAQFQDYLGALHAARSQEKRSIYIDSTGTQSREIVASYMIPMPVWKSSYRLIWAANGRPTLEGWAIVDNTTGEDWSSVTLSLVSGRPISFISRLYEPRYITRPVAELPDDQAQGPVVYEGAIEEKDEEQRARNEKGFAAGQLMNAPASRAMAKESVLSDVSQPKMVAASPSAIAATANGGELGELFEYHFSTPVTVHKNESAMLPFLQQETTARKLLVFREQGSIHPMNSMEITNSTGKTLDGGPITVYEDGAYAGEALIETLKDGDKRLISYGVDLGTRITTAFDSKAEVVREVHFRRGVLATRSAVAETKTYTIRNVDKQEKTVIVEHPLREQYKLVAMKPAETTSDAYRFEVKVAPDATEKFSVNEERVLERTIGVTNLTPDLLVSYVQNKDLPQASRDQLQQILDRKRLIAAADGEIQRTQAQINNLFQDQERLRQNINSLNRVAGQEQQVQTYSRQLAAQEVQLATLRDKLSAAQQRKATLEIELNSLIDKMEF